MIYEKEALCKYLLSQHRCEDCPMAYGYFFCEKGIENVKMSIEELENLKKMRKEYRKNGPQ